MYISYDIQSLLIIYQYDLSCKKMYFVCHFYLIIIVIHIFVLATRYFCNCTHFWRMTVLIELNLVFLSLTGGCTGSSESTLFRMAHCWKSHVTVQIFLNTGPRMQSVTCLATDTCLTADPGVPSLIAARSHTFMEIDREIISTVISLPSEK